MYLFKHRVWDGLHAYFIFVRVFVICQRFSDVHWVGVVLDWVSFVGFDNGLCGLCFLGDRVVRFVELREWIVYLVKCVIWCESCGLGGSYWWYEWYLFRVGLLIVRCTGWLFCIIYDAFQVVGCFWCVVLFARLQYLVYWCASLFSLSEWGFKVRFGVLSTSRTM